MPDSRLTRRRLLGSAAAASAALACPVLGGSVRGANQDIRVAVIGFNGHGQSHILNYLKMPGVRLVALCDADRAVLAEGIERYSRPGRPLEGYVDLRRLLDRKDIDAVSVVTPNHWHALATVWACQAGKDVCVEKPVSHDIWEGRKMVEAARKYRRIVQGDFDKRSNPANQQAAQFLASGRLGRPVLALGYCYKRRKPIGRVGPEGGRIPDSVDYNLWCGPAPCGRLPRVRLHYDWHWQWETGNGEIGNNGPHQLDLIRWLLGKSDLPARVMSFGGRFACDDDGQTPNTHVTLYDYGDVPVIYETRGLGRKPGDDHMGPFTARLADGLTVNDRFDGVSPDTGVFIICQDGYLDMHNMVACDRHHRTVARFDSRGRRDPQSNFIAAVRSRRTEDVRVDILEGHLSTALCHMGNISYRLGRPADPQAIGRQIAAATGAPQAWARFAEHLSAHGVDLADTPAVLGPWLTMDSGAERFTGPHAERANALLKRTYRRPFVIPEQV